MELVEVNERAHERIEAAYLAFLEHVLGEDERLAARELRRFVDLLSAHMEIEESEALPAFRRAAPPHAAAQASLVEGDHVILRRSVAAVTAVLEELAAAGDGRRRLLATRLGPLERLREVLEHHSRREREHFYPVLDTSLDARSRERLGERLARAAQSP